MSECFICAKHAAMPPTVLVAEEHVVIAHLPGDDVYLGYLFVEARRHVPGLGDLTSDEASAVGRAAARWSRALQTVTGADHVYAAVIGHGVDHFHLHLIPRYPARRASTGGRAWTSGRTPRAAGTPRSSRCSSGSGPRLVSGH